MYSMKKEIKKLLNQYPNNPNDDTIEKVKDLLSFTAIKNFDLENISGLSFSIITKDGYKTNVVYTNVSFLDVSKNFEIIPKEDVLYIKEMI